MNFLFFLIPACIKCAHYKPHYPYTDLAKCTKVNTTLYAEQARYDPRKCGIDGKWFTPS